MMKGPSAGLVNWRFAFAALLLAGAALPQACSRATPDRIDLDLADSWTEGLHYSEVARFDFGTAETRSFLGAGWYYDERSRETGETFVWSRGSSSELAFHLGWRRDLVVEFRCRPFQFEGAAPQSLRFELNNTPIDEPIELRPATHQYTIEIPAAAQVLGENRLVVHYDRVDSPSSVTPGATDERELAVAWSELRFPDADPTPTQAGDGLVVLPAGARAEFFPNLRPGSVFRIDGCESVGESPAILEISVLGESRPDPELYVEDCNGSEVEIDLDQEPGLTRLRLATRPREKAETSSGIRLRSPRILSPAVDAVAEESPVAMAAPAVERPNVIIYLVDALRSDRLGVYGCERPLSPHLDAFAAEGVTFTDVIAQSSWTKAAVASIFTGLWPRAHGVNGPDDRLPDSLPTLPELFQSAGYQTGAVVANAYVGRPFGFARGFDYFEFFEHHIGRSEVLGNRIEELFDARQAADRPFFLYVHTIDPHAPYAPPSPYLETFASEVEDPSVGEVETVRGLVLGTVEPTASLGRDLRNLYDAEVAANDASFGRLLETLREIGKLDNTIVIFTSDHGEAFGEHGSWTHGIDLYNEVLSVPLVMRLPGGAGGGQLVGTTVQHIDLMPTLLDLCSIEAPVDLPGSVLIDAFGTVGIESNRTIFAFLDYWGKTGAAAHADGWKVIQPLSADFGRAVELYHHDRDRTELDERADRTPVRSGWLRARLSVALRGAGASQATEVDAETRAQLEALGYMH